MGRMRKNIFTGELEEVPFEGSHIIWREEVKVYGEESDLPQVSKAYNKPLESVSLSCNASEYKERNQELKDNGITGAYYKPDGTLIQESRAARAQIHKLRGCYDKDAGYGDWAG